jgi:alpha-glucosidase
MASLLGNAPQPVQSVAYTERGILIETTHSRIEITFFAPDLVRVRHLPREGNPAAPPVPYAIARPLETWPTVAFVPVFLPKTLLLRTEALTVGVHLSNGTLFFADADGHVLRADMDVAWSPSGAIRHRAALAPDEPLFGLGERATAWDRRGRSHLLWNTDPGGYPKDQDPLNLNIPVYIGLPAPTPIEAQPEEETATGYLVFYENSFYAEFDLGEQIPEVAAHYFQGGELRYYFAAGSVPHLIERYTELTGRHALPPLWLLGYQQSRWSYVPEARVRKLAQDFRDHDVPCDAIHLDIDYMDGYRDFTWDKTRFPDLAGLAADLREMGIKLVAIIDAGIKKDPEYAIYQEGLKAGHFCALPDGKVFHAPSGRGCAPSPMSPVPRRGLVGQSYAP